MKYVLFDYGNVICLPQTAEDAARVTLGDPRAEERYWELRLEYDRGALTEDQYWSGVYGRPVDGGELDGVLSLDAASWSVPNEETVAIIEELAAGGVPMALLSNAPAAVADRIDGLPFLARLRPRLYSARMGLVKPDETIYLRAAENMGADPADVVFVDDRLENIEGAERAGMTGIHFRNASQLRDDLKLVL
ncbi:haloacid dehalogenase [Planotetraspora thailandica]|uniref:Haloacid dehalogenase n=1 Tax=Planotetraspora thailandica TaxID=487172 RepID=A0A8J3V943_9ACTN|nr:HAD family phosphatase [Planotetraspora thailandica]GII57166.1 haloacid dehalogenase [Planotetraspora thailandica]